MMLANSPNHDDDEPHHSPALQTYLALVQDAITDGSQSLATAALHHLLTVLHLPTPAPAWDHLPPDDTHAAANLRTAANAAIHDAPDAHTIAASVWHNNFSTLADVLLTGTTVGRN